MDHRVQPLEGRRVEDARRGVPAHVGAAGISGAAHESDRRVVHLAEARDEGRADQPGRPVTRTLTATSEHAPRGRSFGGD